MISLSSQQILGIETGHFPFLDHIYVGYLISDVPSIFYIFIRVIPLVFSPNNVRKVVKLRGPGASFNICSTTFGSGSRPEITPQNQTHAKKIEINLTTYKPCNESTESNSHCPEKKTFVPWHVG